MTNHSRAPSSLYEMTSEGIHQIGADYRNKSVNSFGRRLFRRRRVTWLVIPPQKMLA
jgi:hypothetical protein